MTQLPPSGLGALATISPNWAKCERTSGREEEGKPKTYMEEWRGMGGEEDEEEGSRSAEEVVYLRAIVGIVSLRQSKDQCNNEHSTRTWRVYREMTWIHLTPSPLGTRSAERLPPFRRLQALVL